MPIVTKGFYKGLGHWRATCYICGQFIGEGGLYDVMDNEEDSSMCRKHREEVKTLRDQIFRQYLLEQQERKDLMKEWTQEFSNLEEALIYIGKQYGKEQTAKIKEMYENKAEDHSLGGVFKDFEIYMSAEEIKLLEFNK